MQPWLLIMAKASVFNQHDVCPFSSNGNSREQRFDDPRRATFTLVSMIQPQGLAVCHWADLCQQHRVAAFTAKWLRVRRCVLSEHSRPGAHANASARAAVNRNGVTIAATSLPVTTPSSGNALASASIAAQVFGCWIVDCARENAAPAKKSLAACSSGKPARK